MENKIIVHSIIKYNNKYLVTKRSKNENVYKEYWDIPRGLANLGETSREALIREVKEEILNPIKKGRLRQSHSKAFDKFLKL